MNGRIDMATTIAAGTAGGAPRGSDDDGRRDAASARSLGQVPVWNAVWRLPLGSGAVLDGERARGAARLAGASGRPR
jgi:hypothetical protein